MKTSRYKLKINKNRFLKIIRKSKWETIVDFRRIEKGGIKIGKLLSAFKTFDISYSYDRMIMICSNKKI